MTRKGNWTSEEDLFLKQCTSNFTKKNWIEISKNLNQKFPNKQKTGKQCRQRYINYASIVQFSNEKKQWSVEQMQTLVTVFTQIGPKWTNIATRMIGKTENSIKNKFYGQLRKFVRKINKQIIKVKNIKPKKLKYQSLTKILHITNYLNKFDEQLKNRSKDIKDQILYCLIYKNSYEISQIISLINKINKFNLDTRSYKIQRQINMKNISFLQIECLKKYSDTTQKNVITQLNSIAYNKKIQSTHSQNYYNQKDEKKEIEDLTKCKKEQNFLFINWSSQLMDEKMIQEVVNYERKINYVTILSQFQNNTKQSKFQQSFS